MTASSFTTFATLLATSFNVASRRFSWDSVPAVRRGARDARQPGHAGQRSGGEPNDNLRTGTQHVGSPATRGNVLLGGIAANAVPEPATWGMMLLGFGAVGFSKRRLRRIALTQLA